MSQSSGRDREEVVAELQARLHIVRALDAALERWPEVAVLAGEAGSVEEFVSGVGSLLGIDETQAFAVSEQQPRRLPREQRARVTAEVGALENAISEYGED